MEQASVQRLARALRVMVVVVFVCNLIVLFFVPTLAAMFTENRWDGRPRSGCSPGRARDSG